MKKPILTILTGVPGSGKTTLSNQILPELDNFSYFDKDMINDSFNGSDRESEFYNRNVKLWTYKILQNLADSNLQVGKNVWIDATYSSEVTNTDWANQFTAFIDPTRIKLIRCIAPEAVIKVRLEKRGLERDENKLQNWNDFLQKEPIHVDMSGDISGIEVDTTKHISKIKRQILSYLGIAN